MPLESSHFPEEVQVAFFIFGLLSDRYEGMSGTYMGKVWEGVDLLFKLYKVSNPSVVMYFMKMYEGVVMAERLDRSEKKRKQAERQATASGGKQYTHNIKG
tara:strand:+ start:206 stop:508 length:303 start_codon:yes stop_codon:yes gene_type:complete